MPNKDGIVEEQIGLIEVENLEKSLTDAVKDFSDLLKTLSLTHTDIYIVVDRGYSGCCDELAIYGSRPETEYERFQRVKKKQQSKSLAIKRFTKRKEELIREAKELGLTITE